MANPWKTVSLVFCISSPLSPSVTVCLKRIRHVVCHFIFRNRTNSVRIESPNDGIASTITLPLYGTALLAHIKKGYSPCSTAVADAPSYPYPSYFNHLTMISVKLLESVPSHQASKTWLINFIDERVFRITHLPLD